MKNEQTNKQATAGKQTAINGDETTGNFKIENPFLGQSISSNTHKTIDLLSAFVPVLAELLKLNGERVRGKVVLGEAKKHLKDFELFPENETFENEASEFLNNVLFDKLNQFCPDNYFFGSHPGDGADFGFWENEETATDKSETGETSDVEILNNEVDRLAIENRNLRDDLKRADRSYNGFKNYETWLVRCWLDANSETAAFWSETASDFLSRATETENFTKTESAIYELEKFMKAYFTDENNPLIEQSNVYIDLLNSAFSVVDFRRLAERLIETAEETEETESEPGEQSRRYRRLAL